VAEWTETQGGMSEILRLSWQKSRTWCQTGVATRRRKHGVVRVSDPDALAKKS